MYCFKLQVLNCTEILSCRDQGLGEEKVNFDQSFSTVDRVLDSTMP